MKRELRRGGFTFKQFFVGHDRCGMKVTTDGVILGGWVSVLNSQRVLDIGTGTGLLALMLAQRSCDRVMIDAVEIDGSAYEQALENIKASPWAARIQVFHYDIKEYAASCNKRYDLIICNPPYFPQGTDCRDEARAKARYSNILTHGDLLLYAEQLLATGGRFCVMLPCALGQPLAQQALCMGWSVSRRVWVKDVIDKAPYIVLLELTRAQCHCEEQQLITHEPDRVSYTEQFKQLAKDFYLAL